MGAQRGRREATAFAAPRATHALKQRLPLGITGTLTLTELFVGNGINMTYIFKVRSTY